MPKKKIPNPYHWTVEFKNEVPYRKVLKQFTDIKKFGVLSSKGHPIHVNGKYDPFSNWPKAANRRVPETLTHSDCLSHLTKVRPIFIVNSPKKKVHEIVFDIDHCDKTEPCNPNSMVELIEEEFVPFGGQAFVEPSRNGQGAYVRLLVYRRSEPKHFDRLLCKVSASFRQRHNEKFMSEHNVKLDAIKGTVWYRFDNPAFDSMRFAVEGKEYEASKLHYISPFGFNHRLERYLYNRGVLITAACFGAYVDGDYDRYPRYLEWAGNRKGKQVIDEEVFADWLAAHPVQTASPPRHKERGAEREEIHSICQMGIDQTPASVLNEQSKETQTPASNGKKRKLNGGLYTKLKDEPDAWIRSVQCCIRLRELLGRDVTYEELDRAYHEQKLFSGADVNSRREKRLRDVARIFGHYDHSLCQQAGFDRRRTKLFELIESRVTPAHRSEVRYKARIDTLDLAVALYVVEINSFNLHGDRDQQYTCGNDAFTSMFEALSEAGVLPEERACGREKAKALKTMLTAAGLIQCLDSKWMPKALSLRGKGTSKKYGIGSSHPRFNDFEFVLKNMPVVRIGQKVEVFNSNGMDAWLNAPSSASI